MAFKINKKTHLFTGFLMVITTFFSANYAHAQQGCDYTIGAGQQYTTLEALNLHTTGATLAGKTVCIMNNKIYGPINILKSGTGDTQQLTIKSHPANSAKPQFTSTANAPVINVRGRYVVIDGLEVTSSGGEGMQVLNTDHVKLLNVKVSETQGHGIQVEGSSYVWIDYCTVRKAVMSTGNTVGENVRAKDSDHVWISNCLITEDGSVKGGVLNSGQSSYTYFHNNELHLNGSNNLHLGNGEHVVFENNLVSAGCGKTGGGFYKQAERHPKDGASYVYKGNDITVKNNVIVNMTKGINILGCQAKCQEGTASADCEQQPWIASEQCPFDNVVIENNTVVGTGMQQSAEDENTEFALNLSAQQNQPVENVRIRNNLFHTANGTETGLKNQMTGDLIFSGNIWSDVTSPPQGDAYVSNWSSVFTGNPNLTTCSNDRKNVNLYGVSSAFAGKGANVNKVGIGRGGGGSTPSPSPSSSPSPTPPGDTTIDVDINNDGKVNIQDYNSIISNFNSPYTIVHYNELIAQFHP